MRTTYRRPSSIDFRALSQNRDEAHRIAGWILSGLGNRHVFERHGVILRRSVFVEGARGAPQAFRAALTFKTPIQLSYSANVIGFALVGKFGNPSDVVAALQNEFEPRAYHTGWKEHLPLSVNDEFRRDHLAIGVIDGLTRILEVSEVAVRLVLAAHTSQRTTAQTIAEGLLDT